MSREREISRGPTERSRGSPSEDRRHVLGNVGLEEEHVFVADGEFAIQACMTAVNLARQEETVVTGEPRCDSKSIGLLENPNKLVQGLLRIWMATYKKGSEPR